MAKRDFPGSITVAASKYNKEKEYWLNKLAGEIQKTGFPADHMNTEAKPAEGQVSMAEITGKGLTGTVFTKLMQLCKNSDYVLHMFFVAGVAAILNKYTGNTDIIVGLPIYKQEKEAEFLNTVIPLRLQQEDRMSFKELLVQVRKTLVEANEHQNYPIETLLFQLNLPFAGDEFPLFDVAVLLENIHDKKYILHTNPNVMVSFKRTPNSVETKIEYNTSKYHRNTMERVLNLLESLIGEAVFNLDTPASELNILSPAQKKQLLVDFNDSQREYPSQKSIDQCFREQAALAPGKIALTYEGEPMTYRQLDEETDALADYLCSLGVQTGEPVAAMVENSRHVIVSILAILKAGGAYVPLNPGYPEERKKYILNDCNTRILLTNTAEPCDYIPDLEIIRLHENIPGLEQAPPRTTEHSGNSLAYIIYTSGSTGTPKGVMVEHKSAVRLVKNTNFIQFKDDDAILLTGALEFDASTFEIWGALLNGLTLHLVHKNTILNHDLLKQFISTHHVTTMWMTAPFFNQVLDTDIEVFSGLRHLLAGGDVLSPTHINRLREQFPGLTVINGYGPTENTTFSTTFHVDKTYLENIPIGKPIANSTAYILDTSYRPVPIGVPGELFVGGDGLARGYLNNPGLTAEKFISPSIPGTSLDTGTPGGLEVSPRVYRTGDLVRWLPDGNVEFLGRKDHQVKIRGFRIEPGEIENHLVRMEAVKEAVVTVRKTADQEKYLCAYVVPSKDTIEAADIADLKNDLSSKLPDYMVPAYLVPLPEIPLTTNGKVNRAALPEPDMTDQGADFAPPTNPVEEKMAGIWSEVLRIDKENIGIDSDFFDLGGHSLKATVLIAKIHEAFGIKLPLAEIFRAPTIRELAEYIGTLTGEQKEQFVSIEPVREKEFYELSSTQKRMYILQEINPGNIAYNTPTIFSLEGSPDFKKIGEVFEKLVHRHESLRTSFHTINEKPVQIIHKEVYFKIGYHDFSLENRDQDEKKTKMPNVRNFIQPFDLSRAPLIRLEFLKIKEDRYLMIIDMHHIINDAPSLALFINEFTTLYKGGTLKPIRIHYKDYSEWQNNAANQKALMKQEKYWLDQFEQKPSVLDLPYDHPRPSKQVFEGDSVRFELPTEQIQALNCLASEYDATLYIVLLTIYYIMLYRLSGQEDIVVGTPIAARRHADLEQIIGMFVNTLALRNYPSGDKTFKDFLSEVKERTLNAFENQEYQFEDLVERVEVTRDISRNPLFDTMFSMQNAGIPEVRIPGVTLKSYGVDPAISKFDLELSADEEGNRIIFNFTYCTSLFERETILRFTSYFKQLVSSVIENCSRRVADLEIIPPMEKKRLLKDFNDTEHLFPANQTIHGVFERHVEKTPDNIAIEGYSKTLGAQLVTLTYQELNEKSNCLSGVLKTMGVDCGTIVGIMADRSIEAIIAILAILKSGGAYLPIDPDYPEDRIKFMLSDSNTGLLLMNGIESKIDTGCEVIDISDPAIYSETVIPGNRPKKQSAATDSPHTYRPNNLAYVIYTSGTTGKPKGVLIEHKSVVNLMTYQEKNYDLHESDRVIQFSSICFDASVEQIFIPLLNGACLVLVAKETLLDNEAFEDFIASRTITHLNTVPSYLDGMCLEDGYNLKRIITGGDVCPAPLAKRLSRFCDIYNAYGPTETTVTSILRKFKNVEDSMVRLPIGRPIANTTVLILNKWMNLTPIGTAGELYIGGIGLGRGYLNRPELTAEKFISLPASSFSVGTGSQKQWETSVRLYKTGDLAKYRSDGDIEFLGRIDNQVKIRGFRIELGEIENRLKNHGQIAEAVVLCKADHNNENYLTAYIVTTDHKASAPGFSELNQYLAHSLPDYMIPRNYVELQSIPLNTNGKIDRKALSQIQEPGVQLESEYIAPQNQTQEKLVNIWSQVLGLEKETIGINANFFLLGGHSLTLMALAAKIRKEFQVKISLAEIFNTPTVKGLEEYIQAASREKHMSVEIAQEKKYYDLSPAQKRMYILQQLAPESTGYNMPIAVEVEGEPGRIEHTLKKIISRHDSLRTSFKVIAEEPVQKIHHHVDFKIQFPVPGGEECEHGTETGTHSPADDLTPVLKTFVRPFDLTQAPLLRVGLLPVGKDKYTMLLDMHHIISDAMSLDILAREFTATYAGEELPPLKLQYKDYSEWLNHSEQEASIKKQEHYWVHRFSPLPPPLHLPVDHEASQDGLTGESTETFVFDESLTKELARIAKEEDVTLYTVLLSAFNVMLSILGGQEDIVVGMPIAGRKHADLENIVGMFVNMLPLRNFPQGKKTFAQFLKEVRNNLLDAFENQDYQFEDLIDKLPVKRDIERNPLVNVVFNYMETKEREENILNGSKEDSYKMLKDRKKFDINLSAEVYGGKILFHLEYNPDLFQKETVARFITYFKEITTSLVEDKNRLLQDISITHQMVESDNEYQEVDYTQFEF